MHISWSLSPQRQSFDWSVESRSIVKLLQVQVSVSKKLEHAPATLACLNEQAESDRVHAMQWEDLAIELAAEHDVSTGIGQGWKLQPRFQRGRAALLTTYSTFITALQGGRELAPTTDRFVKSFHLI